MPIGMDHLVLPFLELRQRCRQKMIKFRFDQAANTGIADVVGVWAQLGRLGYIPQ